jgi:DNA-binding CsgD family transcriptional regulator
MLAEKIEYILLGSDISNSLASIIRSLKGFNHYSFVTSTRIPDSLHIAKSLEPALMIFYFRNPQELIQTVLRYPNIKCTPILCLTRSHEIIEVDISVDLILFTQSFESAIRDRLLKNNVQSILNLVYKTRQFQPNSTSYHTTSDDSFLDQNKNLARYIMELDQKATTLFKIKERIQELYSDVGHPIKAKLMSIVNTIKVNTKDTKHWEDFKLYFENINPAFLKDLSRKYPCLTNKDLKYCCYLKMNMSNEDIRHVLGINQESVRTHKYRLKKKMTLSKNQDLRLYLRAFSN